MSLTFLIGAILGSGIAIFGRAPAQRLYSVVQEQLRSRRR